MPKPKLLITRVLSPAVIERARRDYDVDLNENDHVMSADELVARSRDKDALLVTLTEKLTSEAIAKLPPSVRIVATYSVGYDHIDLAAAKARGIRVSNTPDAVTVATAEIAMLLILGAARRAQEGERLLREKKWAGWQPMQLIGRQARRQAARHLRHGQDRPGAGEACPRLRHGNPLPQPAAMRTR